MKSPFYTAEHEAYRDVVRRFVEKEIEPYAHEWDEAGGFPRELYEKAAAIGLLGLGFPEEYGGTQVDNFMWIVAVQELARAGAGGVSASLALLGDVNVAEPGARAGFAGPNIIEQTIRQKLPKGFQRSEFLLDHGAIDMIVHRAEMRDRMASLLSMIMHPQQRSAG